MQGIKKAAAWIMQRLWNSRLEREKLTAAAQQSEQTETTE